MRKTHDPLGRVRDVVDDLHATSAISQDVADQLYEALDGSGQHTKQLGGTPTGDFADVCSCGKSYWPCDTLGDNK